MQSTEPRLRRRDDAVAIGGLAQIRDQRQDLPREVAADRRRLDFGDISVDMADRDDIVSLAGETASHRPAEATQPTGDDRDPLFH